MPNMANITVKKNDGTTDITYVALSPSAGDKTPAQWRVESIGTVPGNRPTLSVSSKFSVDKMARIVEGKLQYPETYTDTTTGIVATRLRESFSFTHVIRMDAADITTNELSAQAGNLLVSVLMREILKTGYAPS